MKLFYNRFLFLIFLLTSGTVVFGQVKIGGEKGSAPHASAVLELSDSARGFLMPRVTREQMAAIKAPANGLLVYNTSDDKLYVYRQSSKDWKEIIMAPLPAANMLPEGDTSEWVFDADSARVYLRRAVLAADTIFYSPTTGKMIFADKYIYGNSQGLDFNVDLLGGKFTFKATSSMMQNDTNRVSNYTTSIVKEIDYTRQVGDFQSGLLVATTVNPKATQVTGQAQGANISAIHAGQDTLSILSGVDITATVNGNGYTEEVWGLSNAARISNNSRNDVGNMYGMRNTLTRSGLATGRVTGNVYGYLGSVSGLSDKVDGTIYGIYLGNVQNGSTRRNYGIFTNKGLNRFGDSVLVTDNFASQPRAVFDINSTSAMVLPNGSTAQRPATNVQGMFRYNNTTNSPEYNNGASWLSLGSGGEWDFNSLLNRVQLTRALGLNDTTYYSTTNRHFIFADRATYTNSLGQDFSPDLLGGKFTFKATASRTSDTTEGSLYTTGVIKEIDNSGNNYDFHSGMLIATTINPKATQITGQAQGLNVSAIHAGQDTAQIVSGVDITASANGNGYTEELYGLASSARMNTNSRNDVGNMYGVRSTLTRSTLATGRINGNAYGYFGNFGGLSDKVDGTIYGIFLGNVQNGTTRRNYGIFTSKGLNRFGDSVLVTDNFASQPRAVFDINSTSAMVLPNGSTAQRPSTNVQGMFRYNNTTNSPEYNNGASWLSLGSGGEWDFNSLLNRVQLTRALGLNDTTYYSTVSRHFIFADRATYTNSLGQDFSTDLLGGKFSFKSTASRTVDTADGSVYTASVVREVDNTSTNGDVNSGLLVATTVNPKSFQVTGQAQGVNVSTIHAGNDTAYIVSGIDNIANVNGNGYAGELYGMSNIARMNNNAHNNVGTMYGIRNTLSRSPAATGRISGNAYGYWASFSGLSDKVDGTIYGLYLNAVVNGSTRRNYGIYTNQGLNRFGDSVLISNTGAILPRAIFDINATSAMVLPNGTTAQRPATNVQGMLRYNNTTNYPEYNNGTGWVGISTDEWVFSPDNRVTLNRGLPVGDSIFYSTANRHFIFGDRTTYTNSLGQDFAAQLLGGKFTFKSTASKMPDSASSSVYTAAIINEVDNASNTFNDAHSGLLVAATINPKSTQTSSQVEGLSVSSIHAGQNSVSLVSGIDNATTVNGLGYADVVTGFSNLTRMSTNARNNVGSITGFNNAIARSGTATGRITGDVFGYQGSFNGLSTRVDGTIYGIYLGPVQNGSTRRNYSLYTNAGLNRFGDSVLITNAGATQPRAVLDINATSSMIVPVGTSSQRPAAAVTGMVRYNTDNGGTLESYNGSSWNGIIRNSQAIDVPNIAANSSVNVTVTVAGATVGSVVYVSPSSALPASVVIASARVTATNTVEIKYNNVSAPAVNPSSQTYYIRVIQ
ncbi:MAG: hypothetical protein U0X40_10705 [Ferruginibacter sp.]